jgi:type I restriction enzyme S subunit
MGWSPFTITDVEFLAFLIKARGLSELADTSTVPQLNNKHILPEKFPLPDRNEQKAIVSYLKNQTSKIDSLITETESAISLLKEHRSALITNAVTGKINVEALV